ncbi:MAG: hypothetical protein MUF34_29895 [Polyangiaceae bacterium]|jgi:hypothetical protein|nr:hypothetical protein [Polyangiaceae bacterium]
MNRFNSFLGIGVMGLMIGFGSITMAACGDDDDDNVAGSAGKAGTAGAAGTAGKSGSGGSGGVGGAGAGGAGAGGAGAGGAGAGGAGAGGAGAGGAGAGGAGGAPPGPGAALKCTSDTTKNAFQLYGAAFGAFNQKLIDTSVTSLDNTGAKGVAEFDGKSYTIGESFGIVGTPNGQSEESLTTNLGAFLTYVYGGPFNYQGRSMEAAHNGLNITSDQYDQFVGMIVDILVSPTANGGFNVPEADVNSCFAPPLVDAAFKASIVNQ